MHKIVEYVLVKLMMHYSIRRYLLLRADVCFYRVIRFVLVITTLIHKQSILVDSFSFYLWNTGLETEV